MFSHRIGFMRAFRSRRYTMLWIGQAISSLGNNVFTIALAWQVLLMTHSGAAMGLVLLATSIPQIIFILVGGVAADRLPRRMIILWSDGGRGLIVLLITILGLAGQLQFWYLVIEALIFGIVNGFFNPAVMSIMPDLIEKEDLAAANALKGFSDNIARLLGPLLGALLIAVLTPMGAFAFNALSFFLSVAFLVSIRIPEYHITRHASALDQDKDAITIQELTASALHHAYKESLPGVMGRNLYPLKYRKIVLVPLKTESKTEGQHSEAANKMTQPGAQAKHKGFRWVLDDMREGFGYVQRSRWLWVSILASSIANIGIAAPLGVGLPLLVNKVYGQGAWLLGMMSTSSAIGSILALLVIGQAARMKRRGLLAYLSMCLTSLGLIILGLPIPHMAVPVIASLAEVMIGFGLAFFNTVWFTVLQEMIPREKLGRVLSLDTLGSLAMTPAAQGIGGILTDSLGATMVFLLGGLLCLITTLLPLSVREIREVQ